MNDEATAPAEATPREALDLMAAIRWRTPYLNTALRRIGHYVVDNPQEVKSISIKDLAGRCNVSESTVTRFVKALGMPSFQLMKIRIAEQLSFSGSGLDDQARAPRMVYEDITPEDTVATIIGKIGGRYIDTVTDTVRRLSADEVARAVDAIQACSHLVFFAIGSSSLAAENAVLRFMRVGKSCIFHRDFVMQHFSTAILNETSLAIGICNSGRTITTVDAMQGAKRRGAKTLCITSFPNSPIVKYSDIKLFTPTISAPQGSAMYQESMLSKIAQLLTIDVLYSGFAVKNYEKSIDELERTGVYTLATRYQPDKE